eukprot:TRINITY_DN738_c0_g2_i1.p1 TRINITY_DN738_c0_g2~~TRINITY_DN738_c0_g2_i1.p1  ORF type:complete len:1244 (-),score=314.87 TRINITY_DN738_c0_g2_i1:1275-5006(-)
MKRLRSYGEDLDCVADKGFCKDRGRRDHDFDRPSSHRRFYSKSDNGRKGLYDRSLDDDREALRSSRKRFDHRYDAFDRRKGFNRGFDHESDGFDRRKGYDRTLDHESDVFERRKGFDRYDRGTPVSSPRNGERVHRSESFSRREFPKGFRSERERPRREESSSVLAWRRSVGNGKETDEDLRSGSESGRGKRVGSEDRGSARSSPGSREVGKSPQWSKDSGGEQSKNSEMEKIEAADGENGSGSEMEEGELEPDPKPQPELQPKSLEENEHVKCGTRVETDLIKEETSPESENSQTDAKGVCDGVIEPNKCGTGVEMVLVKEEKSLGIENLQTNGQGVCEGIIEGEMLETVTDVVGENDKLLYHMDDALNEGSEKREDAEANGSREKEENIEEECAKLPSPAHEHESLAAKEESNEEENLENPLPLEDKHKQENGMDLEVKEGDTGLLDSNKEVVEESRSPQVTLKFLTDKLHSSKEKGKDLVVSASHEGNYMEGGERMAIDLLTHKDDAMEGPRNGVFDLFCSDAMRPEKKNCSGVNQHKVENLKMEPLELSLGLPNVSLTLASHDTKVSDRAPSSPSHAPNSVSHARSVHSLPTTLRTSSDDFTTSMSFTGSQTFIHNPSCSLTHNSFENYEQSVGSHPIFQGVDQISQGGLHGQSSNEQNQKEIPLYQRLLRNCNGSLHASQAPQGILIGQAVQGPYLKVSEGSAGTNNVLDRQLSLSRQFSGQLRREEVRSPTYSSGSRETRSEHSKDKKRVMNGGSVVGTGQREMEQLILTGHGVAERIIYKVVSDPIQIMARGIQEMTERSVEHLKECVCELMQNEDKSGRLHAFQEALTRRTDLTLEMLTNCHRAQLEILVALKTGLREFLQQAKHIPTADLVEIFLNLRCRNLACRSILPVDECDCKICMQKNGFCSQCMCLVCSKFDLACNTCSWVGCDVCLHWCHTDCGLREFHIRNGQSVGGTQGSTEMQFHCIACGHPSEMFGFVKEVFKTFAKDWKAETLSKELEYVKRIFHSSDDIRGRQLHDVAARMLEKLERKSNPSEVYNGVMMFLTESNSKIGSVASACSVKEPSQKNTTERNNGIVCPSQEPMWLKSVSAERAPCMEDAARPNLDWDHVGGGSGVRELQLNVEKRPVVDELESIVRIKQAEAKMFQARADDARREAESLKCIAVAKNEKIEEEHTCRITKLRLVEAEARRRQKLEELQALERENLEYFNMKKRMEADVKDLLLKMEATKHNRYA